MSPKNILETWVFLKKDKTTTREEHCSNRDAKSLFQLTFDDILNSL